MMNYQDLLLGLLLIAVVVFSLSFHEFAHAYVANLFGDPTARLEGRQTLNPLAHWDPIGTSLLAVLLFLQQVFGLPIPVFGWGKPVPVNEDNFDNPRITSIQVSLAGPLSNLILAMSIGLLVRFVNLPTLIDYVAIRAVYVNLFLMFFNLMPIPPLDGSSILRLIISDRAYFSLVANPLLFFVMIFLVLSFVIGYIGQISSFLATKILGG